MENLPRRPSSEGLNEEPRPSPSSVLDKGGEDEDTSDYKAVVGWLVIVSGPGYGQGFPLSYGRNILGWDADQKFGLHFGEHERVLRKLLVITYDGTSNQFEVFRGTDAPAVYLNKQAIHGRVPLNGRHRLKLSEVEVIFVPFCSPQFDWQRD